MTRVDCRWCGQDAILWEVGPVHCLGCGHRVDVARRSCDCRQCQHGRQRGVLPDEQASFAEEERRMRE